MTKYNRRIRFAVIGCGHIGKRHIQVITERTDAEVIALCDIQPRKKVLPQNLLPDTPYYTSVAELLRQEQGLIDIACICVPNGGHFEVALALIRQGIDVVIEKPLVLDLEHAQQLEQEALETGSKIFGVLQNRYSTTSQWLKGLVQEGKLGKLFSLRMQCLWNRDHRYYTPDSWHGKLDQDGGTLYTQYSHFVDLLLWIFGPMEVEEAEFYNLNHRGNIEFEDTGEVKLRSASGVQTNLFYSTAVHGRNMEVSLTILAENGAIRLGGNYLNQVEHCSLEGVSLPEQDTNQGNQYGGYTGSAQNHRQVIDHIIRAINGIPADTTGLREGVAVVDLIQRIYAHRHLPMEE